MFNPINYFGNIMCISDIHTADYPRFNYYSKHLLDNYNYYGDRVIELAIENNCRVLIIAGDLLDKDTNQPYVLKVMKDMLTKFGKHFDHIYYILGQHDLQVNTDDHDVKYSSIHLIVPDNSTYMDKKEIVIGGRNFAFMDYYKYQDLSWFSVKPNWFIGHVTFDWHNNYQNIDFEAFDQGVFGDIHNPIDYKNGRSIGCQVQRSYSDYIDGSFIIIDLHSNSCVRKLIDEDRSRFMRLIETDDFSQEGFSEELNSRGIPKFYASYKAISSQATSLGPETITKEQVENNPSIMGLLTQADLDHIHQMVLNRYKDSDSIDMNFRLLRVKLFNYRSIDDLEIDFSKTEGTVLVHGLNGSGKSSLLYGIYDGLKGGDLLSNMRDDQSSMLTEIDIFYQNKVFTIWRDGNSSHIAIDNEWQNYGSKRAYEAAIYKELPFLYNLDSFFFTDESTSILSSFSADRRVSLLSSYHRLDVISSYCSISGELKSEEGNNWSSLNGQLTLINGRIAELEKKISEGITELNKSPLGKLSKEQFESNILELNKELGVILTTDTTKVITQESISRKYRDLKVVYSDLPELPLLTKEYVDKRCLDLDLIILPEVHPTTIQKLSSELQEKYSALNALSVELKSNQTKLESSSEIVCSGCNKVMHLADGIKIDKVLVQKEIDRISELGPTLNKEYTDAYNFLVTINKIPIDNANHTNQINSLKDLLSDINHFNTVAKIRKVSEVQSDIQEYTTFTSNKAVLYSIEEELKKYKEENDVENLTNELEKSNKLWWELDAYEKLFSNKGPIYNALLSEIIKKFNNGPFRYDIFEAVDRGKTYLDFTCSYKAPDSLVFRPYSKLSRGQKTLCDLNFILNLVTKSGIIVFDEFYKFLDPLNLPIGAEIVNEMNATIKIVTSQSAVNSHDHSIGFRYDGSISHITNLNI